VGNDEVLRRDVEEIHKAGERGSSMARQLLAFGRKQVTQPRPIDPNPVLSEMEQLLRVITNDGIQLSMNLKSTGAIMADPTQIEQVITTLVHNARDAMPGGGRIVIETADGPDHNILLSVSDTGTGMDPEAKSHLFEPFFTTKPKGMGVGLGLATIFNIVKQSGGQVLMNSELGQGTTIKISLPRVEGVAAGEGASSDPHGSETVLLVEDDPSILHLTRQLLQDRGYQVVEAPSGAEALRLARQHRGAIQLLLAEVMLSGMSGREVYDRLIGERPELKVLFMSGHADEIVRDHGVFDSAFAFLQKPFTPRVLSQAVRKRLDS
jgi:CheY-like chemotaxis protein